MNTEPSTASAVNHPQGSTANNFMVKPYSPGELCVIYGVSRKTWDKWLSPFAGKIGKRCGRYYTVLQVEIIIQHVGVPHWLE